MPITTPSSDRDDRPEQRPDERSVPRRDDVVVLSPEDYVVLDRRAPVEHVDASVQRVTAARGSHTEDVGRRMRNYAFSMGIRTLCVIAFIVSFPHWFAWLFVPGAVLLPYVAVILANASTQRTPTALTGVPTTDTGPAALPTSRPV